MFRPGGADFVGLAATRFALPLAGGIFHWMHRGVMKNPG